MKRSLARYIDRRVSGDVVAGVAAPDLGAAPGRAPGREPA